MKFDEYLDHIGWNDHTDPFGEHALRFMRDQWEHQQKEIDRLHRHIDDFQAEARKAREDADRLKQLIDDHNRYTDIDSAADTCDCGLYLLCPDCPNGHFIDDEQGERLED